MKMKRNRHNIIFTVATFLLLFSTVSFAAMQGKLEHHWAKTQLKEKTVLDFFPKFAENNFERFAPAETISRSEFVESLNLLFQKYNKEPISGKEAVTEPMNRKELLSLLAPVVKNEDGTFPIAIQKNQFKDCGNLLPDELLVLQLLTERTLLKGSSKTQFLPDQILTQGEAMILIQRLNDHFRKLLPSPLPAEENTLAFKVISSAENYSDQEGVLTKETKDTIRLTITKQFSTPGYSLSVKKMAMTEKGIFVSLNITSPAADAILPQVITYQKITVEVQKNEIPANIPSLFFVEGLRLEYQ